VLGGAGEPEGVEQGRWSGLRRRGPPGTMHDGEVLDGHVEPAEHGLGVGGRLEVQPFRREPVAGHDLEQSPGVGVEV
jgi:hypothetical protein